MIEIDKKISLFIIIIHSFPIYFWNSLLIRKHLLLICIFSLLKMIAVTAGFHRLWTHKSYNPVNNVKIILSIFCNSTFEASIKEWTSNHRMHHRFEDSNPSLDPYSIKKGFLWAHMFCHFFKKKKIYLTELNKVKKELEKERSNFDNKLIDFEDKHYNKLAIISGLVLPTFFFKFFFKDSLFTCLGSVILSIILTWHLTWSINSVAHIYGDKDFSTKHTSGNSHILSFFTCGEGYHNYHHSYPKDYKASKNLFCFNLTGWFIYLLYKLKMATKLIQVKNIGKKELPNFNDIDYKTLK